MLTLNLSNDSDYQVTASQIYQYVSYDTYAKQRAYVCRQQHYVYIRHKCITLKELT